MPTVMKNFSGKVTTIWETEESTMQTEKQTYYQRNKKAVRKQQKTYYRQNRKRLAAKARRHYWLKKMAEQSPAA